MKLFMGNESQNISFWADSPLIYESFLITDLFGKIDSMKFRHLTFDKFSIILEIIKPIATVV